MSPSELLMRPRYSSDQWRLRPRARHDCTRVIRHTPSPSRAPSLPPYISPIFDKSEALTAGGQLVPAVSERRFHGPASLVFTDSLLAWNQQLLQLGGPPRASALSAFCICSSLRVPHCSLLSSFSLRLLFLAAFPREFFLCVCGESVSRRDASLYVGPA